MSEDAAVELTCNCCGRRETEPYEVGDTCYDGCGIFTRTPKEEIK